MIEARVTYYTLSITVGNWLIITTDNLSHTKTEMCNIKKWLEFFNLGCIMLVQQRWPYSLARRWLSWQQWWRCQTVVRPCRWTETQSVAQKTWWGTWGCKMTHYISNCVRHCTNSQPKVSWMSSISTFRIPVICRLVNGVEVFLDEYRIITKLVQHKLSFTRYIEFSRNKAKGLFLQN